MCCKMSEFDRAKNALLKLDGGKNKIEYTDFSKSLYLTF